MEDEFYVRLRKSGNDQSMEVTIPAKLIQFHKLIDGDYLKLKLLEIHQFGGKR